MHQEVVTTWYSYSFSDTTVILCPQQAHEKKNTETAQTRGFLWKSGTPKSWSSVNHHSSAGCLRAIFWPADPKALWGSQWAPKRHHRLRKWVGYPWRPGKCVARLMGKLRLKHHFQAMRFLDMFGYVWCIRFSAKHICPRSRTSEILWFRRVS